MDIVFLFGGFRVCKYKHCQKAFGLGTRHILYCSRRCANLSSMRAWRDKNKQTFAEKACEMCLDGFTPKRSWQRFCCRECMILHQNTYGRGDGRKLTLTPNGLKREEAVG